LLNKKHYDRNEFYNDEFDLVVGVSYGSEGIAPCNRGCKDCCVSSSGDCICGGCFGWEEVVVDGTKLYIVKCATSMECIE
jgi:hypothetical protein